VFKFAALAAPFVLVIVMLVNGLHADRVMAGLLVLSLAIAGVALGAIFGPGAGPSRD
jgi:urea transporter